MRHKATTSICGHLPVHGRGMCKPCYDEQRRLRNPADHAAKQREWRARHLAVVQAKDAQRFTPTYSSWSNMTRRCNNPSHPRYADWGGRGITVCDRWNPKAGGSYANFLADMGEKPPGTSLDRKDNDGNYEPGNCRWATALEQRHNRRPVRR